MNSPTIIMVDKDDQKILTARIHALEAQKADLLAALKASQNTSSNLRKQVADLLAALKFYAEESNYTGWTDPDYQWTGESKDYDSSIESDMGEIARQAIADAEEARKSPVHECDVELPEHDDLPSIAYEELPE